VASFFVSERVLKPKASLLVILGCVLAYDLTTKTQDVSSLRVYRGTFLLFSATILFDWLIDSVLNFILTICNVFFAAGHQDPACWPLRS
jgi:hypothetical protein